MVPLSRGLKNLDELEQGRITYRILNLTRCSAQEMLLSSLCMTSSRTFTRIVLEGPQMKKIGSDSANE